MRITNRKRGSRTVNPNTMLGGNDVDVRKSRKAFHA
jgi:hypothetical protein